MKKEIQIKIMSTTKRLFHAHGQEIKPYSRVFITHKPNRFYFKFFKYYLMDGDSQTRITESNVDTLFKKEEEPVEVSMDEAPTTFVCQYCGKELKSAAGKASHERSCSQNPDKGE